MAAAFQFQSENDQGEQPLTGIERPAWIRSSRAPAKGLFPAQPELMLHCEDIPPIQNWPERYGTPLYVYSGNRHPAKRLSSFQKAFSRCSPHHLLLRLRQIRM